MKGFVKKGIIFSLIGVMQLGIGASVIEASPKHENRNHKQHWDNRDHRIQEERDRHEREMARRDHEEEWQWKERQKREKDHHEEVMRTLGGIALLYILTNN
ncbi:hypothetical protein [Pelosinus propionicus]|uniref:Uncharacterized protein n=1 Tax=Pelosinus propionicus DSM 13327 TaxID=1123291 RepID=A0A1I4N6H5_9FIRM|nr:hypothetical protein [Pelosinus propionicus]SFM10995.1 hypothetical protein SAMN04490355_104141 [Pelosinus propionicus DSM 13327]